MDNSGKVNYAGFLSHLRGNLNQERVECIKKAYDKINVNGSVKLDDIA
jgi:hypothetical protein